MSGVCLACGSPHAHDTQFCTACGAPLMPAGARVRDGSSLSVRGVAVGVVIGGIGALLVLVALQPQRPPTTTALPAASAVSTPVAASSLQPGATLLARSEYRGVFVPAGQWPPGRVQPTSTLLADGNVLIAGGCDPGGDAGAVVMAERFDPGAMALIPTGSMVQARCASSATRLLDGQVLIAGGDAFTDNSTVRIASAELYDPVTRTFRVTGPLREERLFHASMLLDDGRVLVVGGDGAGGRPRLETELYDPQTASFRRAGSLSEARLFPILVRLPHGRILITGGVNDDFEPLESAEVFDPVTDAFTRLASVNTTGASAAVGLEGGRVLLIGARDPDGNATARASLLDPATDSLSATGPMTLRRLAPSAASLADGSVLVVCGEGSDGLALVQAELYDPATGTFRPTGSMRRPRDGSCIVTALADGRVLVLGGRDNDGSVVTDAEVFE